jgi:hypothetical protein
MVLAMDAAQVPEAQERLAAFGDRATVIGCVTDRPGVVIL